MGLTLIPPDDINLNNSICVSNPCVFQVQMIVNFTIHVLVDIENCFPPEQFSKMVF